MGLRRKGQWHVLSLEQAWSSIFSSRFSSWITWILCWSKPDLCTKRTDVCKSHGLWTRKFGSKRMKWLIWDHFYTKSRCATAQSTFLLLCMKLHICKRVFLLNGSSVSLRQAHDRSVLVDSWSPRTNLRMRAITSAREVNPFCQLSSVFPRGK